MVSAPPSKRLRTVLDEELKAEETLNVVYTAEQSFSADSLPDGLRVGRKDWTASSSHAAGLGQQVHILTEKVQTMQEALGTVQADVSVLGAQFISNVAAQGLLFACQDQPRNDPPNRRFRKMAKAGSAQLSAYLGAWPIPPAAESFGEAADAVINRTNTTLHYSNLTGLEKDVEQALQMMVRNPALRNKCIQESSILDTFKELKAAYNLQ